MLRHGPIDREFCKEPPRNHKQSPHIAPSVNWTRWAARYRRAWLPFHVPRLDGERAKFRNSLWSGSGIRSRIRRKPLTGTKSIEEAAPAHGRTGALLQDTKGDE